MRQLNGAMLKMAGKPRKMFLTKKLNGQTLARGLSVQEIAGMVTEVEAESALTGHRGSSGVRDQMLM